MAETLVTALRRTAANMRVAAEGYRGSTAYEVMHAFAREIELLAADADRPDPLSQALNEGDGVYRP